MPFHPRRRRTSTETRDVRAGRGAKVTAIANRPRTREHHPAPAPGGSEPGPGAPSLRRRPDALDDRRPGPRPASRTRTQGWDTRPTTPSSPGMQRRRRRPIQASSGLRVVGIGSGRACWQPPRSTPPAPVGGVSDPRPIGVPILRLQTPAADARIPQLERTPPTPGPQNLAQPLFDEGAEGDAFPYRAGSCLGGKGIGYLDGRLHARASASRNVGSHAAQGDTGRQPGWPCRVGPFHADRLATRRRCPSLFLRTSVLGARASPPASISSGLAVPFAGEDARAPRTPTSESGAVSKISAALIRPNRVPPREPVPQREMALPCRGDSTLSTSTGVTSGMEEQETRCLSRQDVLFSPLRRASAAMKSSDLS